MYRTLKGSKQRDKGSKDQEIHRIKVTESKGDIVRINQKLPTASKVTEGGELTSTERLLFKVVVPFQSGLIVLSASLQQ